MNSTLVGPIPSTGETAPRAGGDHHSPQSPSEVPDRVSHFEQRRGKRIRASIVEESFRLAGGVGDFPHAITDAVERLHAGSLIIDDIEDDSEGRRGRPALHREVGVPQALNTGNLMYFQALEELSRAPFPGRIRSRIVGRTIRSVRRCHEGQAIDLSVRADKIARDTAFRICQRISRLKTGSLTGLSAWIGSIVADPPPTKVKALTRFGRRIGVCLQMRNDLQELERFVGGDPRCDDLRNVRITWPWAWAAHVVSELEFRSLQGMLLEGEGNVDRLRPLAARLLARIGDDGHRQISRELAREFEILSQHVVSTDRLRSVIRSLESR